MSHIHGKSHDVLNEGDVTNRENQPNLLQALGGCLGLILLAVVLIVFFPLVGGLISLAIYWGAPLLVGVAFLGAAFTVKRQPDESVAKDLFYRVVIVLMALLFIGGAYAMIFFL